MTGDFDSKKHPFHPDQPQPPVSEAVGDPPPGYDVFETPFGDRFFIHLYTARVCCQLYRVAMTGRGSQEIAKAMAFGAYVALHPADTTGDAVMEQVNRIIAYGFKKGSWYMMGREKPKQLELQWACKPPKLRRVKKSQS